MKRTLLVIISLYSCHTQAQQKIFLKAGYSFTSFRYIKQTNNNNSFASYDTHFTSNYQAGVIGEVRLQQRLWIQTGLNITSRGTKLRKESDGDSSTSTLQLIYLQVPCHLIYKIPLSHKKNIFMGSGFYIARMIWGGQNGHGVDKFAGPYTINGKIEISSHNDNQLSPAVLKPFDYGYSFFAGTEIHKFRLTISYNGGLANLSPNSKLYNGNFKNSSISCLLGYTILDR